LIFIITGVGVFIVRLTQRQSFNRSLIEGQLLEAAWTLLPAVVLVAVALPSLSILYNLDSSVSSNITIKVIGHQWYWSYEYSDFWNVTAASQLAFDSYMVPRNELEPEILRLIDVDNRSVAPFLTKIRALITRADVLHSWAVPSLGVKLDATPGRLNQLTISSYRPGVVYGQCSEICGANHRYIPIVVEFISPADFFSWVLSHND
jgi:cytochrome c oxidase subunit 2